MDKLDKQNKALSEAIFSSLPTGVHEMTIQEEQTTTGEVGSCVVGKLEEHCPGENGLENL